MEQAVIQWLSSEEVDIYWSIIKTFLSRVDNHGEESLEDMKGFLHDGTRMALVINDWQAVCVVEFIEYPTLKMLRVTSLAGEGMDEWMPDLVVFLDKWAKENDLKYIEQVGRKGWVKALKPYGFEPVYICMRKPV